MNLEEHKKQIKKLKKIEKELTNLIVILGDKKILNTFFKWQNQREICNIGFSKVCVDILSGKIVDDDLLSVSYLMNMHNDLNYGQAESLLSFCNKHTIKHKECYGDGVIMFSEWLKSKQ